MSAPILGVDPAQEGGGVLLAADGRTALSAWSWVRQSGLYALFWTQGDSVIREGTAPSLHAIAQQMTEAAGALDTPWYAVVERLFARAGKELHGVCELAEAAGELLGPLRDVAASVERPLASQWRPKVLGGSAVQSSLEAEDRAWRALAAARPPLVRGLDAWLEQVERTVEGERRIVPRWPHVLEAACMARWGFVTIRPAQMALAMGRR